MMKQLQLLCSQTDEESLSRLLIARYPSLVVIDGSRWETPEPPVVRSIAACQSSIVMLWNQEITPALAGRLRPDGQYDGPIVGPVLQFVRSRLEETTLRSGRIAASSDAPAMEEFIRDVWRMLRTWGITKVRSVNPATGDTILSRVDNFLIGPDAASWWSIEEGRLLMDRSTENYFAPASRPAEE